MHLVHRAIAAIILTAALAAPVTMLAAPAPQDGQAQVYDTGHRQYHNWDNNENRAWGVYLSETHRIPLEYSRASRSEQEQYWNWRYANPER